MAATEQQIAEAYKYYKDFGRHYGWSEDLIQDAITSFYQYYDGSTKVNSFAKLCAESKLNSELAKKYSHKHKHTGISLNDLEHKGNFDYGREDWLDTLISEGTPDYFANEDTNLRVEYYLSLVSPKQRQIMEWIYFDGLTMVEVGKKLGISRQAVLQRLNNAIKKINKKII